VTDSQYSISSFCDRAIFFSDAGDLTSGVISLIVATRGILRCAALYLKRSARYRPGEAKRGSGSPCSC